LADQWNEQLTHGAPLQKLAPRLLIFVEGVSENCSPIPNKHWAFWGGALDSAAAAPVRLALPSKLVYSPHVRREYVHGPLPATLASMGQVKWTGAPTLTTSARVHRCMGQVQA